MDCDICCKKYTDYTRQKISCFGCDFSCCKTCIKTYVMNQVKELKDPHCMNCKIAWNSNFIIENTDKAFYKKMEIASSDNYFETEKLLLQSTMPIVERKMRVSQVDNEIKSLRQQIKELNRLMREKQVLRYNIMRGNLAEEKSDEKEERKIYVCRCPSENCRGFVGRNHKCGICGIDICKDCQIPLEDEHKCDQDVVENVKLIMKDSKHCPSCSTLIYKIEGCDQMFCTQCNTPFSWSRGTIEKGAIHNPHYFEWQRRNGNVGRNPHDVQCGGLPGFLSIPAQLGIDKIYQLMMHIQNAEIYIYDIDPLRGNQDLRVGYLSNDITEEAWKNVLKKRFKKRQKNVEILGVLNMFLNTVASILTNIVYIDVMNNKSRTEKKALFETEIQVLENLREYYNEEMEKISNKFNSNVPYIDLLDRRPKNWKMVYSKKMVRYNKDGILQPAVSATNNVL
jgi:hypothetical protein